MNCLAPHFDRFLLRLHRRDRLVHLLEHAGLGMLWGCGFAIAIWLLLYLCDVPFLRPATACLFVGVAVGIVRGILSLPTTLRCAVKADCQLRLADLLSSALMVKASASSDPWSSSVLALANRQAAALTPSQVVLHRLGARSWAVIGLATALVLTLLLFAAAPRELTGYSREALPVALAHARPLPAHPLIDLSSMRSRASINALPEVGEDLNRGDGNATSADDRSKASTQHADPSDKSHGSSIAASDGSGGGAGRSDAGPQASSPQQLTAVSSRAEDANGRHSAGIGASANPSANGSDAASGRTANSDQAHKTVAPWQGADWSNDVTRAHLAIDSGQVPAQYREMVRDYFDSGRSLQ